ncbi:MAG: DNA mismatch endonuclease Vsr [Candidatus Hydrogenedentes bacterium]|nr:DNA mismatch endonuclease Vsr [Candidatus Hydrogenedentota bacterium]
MADKLTPAERSENMRRIASKNTSPELAVRSAAHRLGYRFRLHRKDLPGKPDLVFPRLGKVIFVHGCFWHQHKKAACKDARLPKSRREYWVPKLTRNVERDKSNQRRLRRLGWKCLILWECEVKDAERLERRLLQFLGEE